MMITRTTGRCVGKIELVKVTFIVYWHASGDNTNSLIDDRGPTDRVSN